MPSDAHQTTSWQRLCRGCTETEIKQMAGFLTAFRIRKVVEQQATLIRLGMEAANAR